MKKMKMIFLGGIITLLLCLLFYLNMNIPMSVDSPTFLLTSQTLVLEQDSSKLLIDFNSPKSIEDDSKLEESSVINWSLFNDGIHTSGITNSFIVFEKVEREENAFDLNRLHGSQNFSKGKFEFSWSYGSSFFVWIYPEIDNYK